MSLSPHLPDELKQLRPQLLRVARQLSGNADQAQDLCQEVLLKLWVRQHKGDDTENLRAYAMTTLRNHYHQALRDRQPVITLEDVTLATPPLAPSVLALHDLRAAIETLPADLVRLMRLIQAGETSPVGTVMSRQARARLRADMGLKGAATVQALL